MSPFQARINSGSWASVQDQWHRQKADLQNLSQHLPVSDFRDSCRCRCSPSGCIPFHWFLRGNSSSCLSKDYLQEYEADRLGHSSEIMTLFTLLGPVMTSEQLNAAIRFWTFEALEIRHTCLHGENSAALGGSIRKERSDEEIREILDEDAPLLEILEDLVDEFESRYYGERTKDGSSAPNFWKGYWLTRMREVLRSLNGDVLDEENRLAAEQLGVTWHDARSTESGQRSGYNESDWDSNVDEDDMWECFETIDDWTSRVDLIMAKAYSD
jgi:hypothetical protein